jgi:hypothetical protein
VAGGREVQAVPDGILLFVSSYGVMDQLTKDWQVCHLIMESSEAIE